NSTDCRAAVVRPRRSGSGLSAEVVMKFTSIKNDSVDVQRDYGDFFRRNGGGMAKLVGAGVVGFVALALLFSVVRMTRINAGYVGVEVNMAGTQRGADDVPIRTGWVFYSPLKTQVIEYPTFVQTVKWTSDTNEGHPMNEELVFNSKEGQEVRADVSLSYAID